jgi:glycosyltransferase involved in cell wall biosynthesis
MDSSTTTGLTFLDSPEQGGFSHQMHRSSQPLKIAQVVFSLQPGGMENGVVNLANHMSESKALISFLCLEEAGAFAERLKPGVIVQTLGRRPGWDWRACWRLGWALHHLQPDVIHTHNLGPLIYATTARLMFPSLWRTPILHGEHGVLQGEGLLPRRLRQRRRLFQRCRIVHTVSEGLRQELISHGMPAGKLVSILNGVDCDRFSPTSDMQEARRNAGLPKNAFVIGAVGRFIATKRYPLLIEAFEILAPAYPDCHLMILGDGGTESKCVKERILRSPFAARIHAQGHQAEPAPFYQAMDILVMPSSHEGLANALLEAMASGVPVLAHAACGAGEVIQNDGSGFLAEINSAAELSDRIRSLIAQPELLSLVSKNARKSARTNFSLASMVRNYLEVFRHVSA